MKKLATLLIACFVVQFASAQYVIVNSPAGIIGGKAFSIGEMSVDLTTSIWTADVVMADPALGCTDFANAAAVAGKIVLVDRGTCNFTQKVWGAKKAGAIAIVVFNHTAGAGTFVMGNVAIPADLLPAIPAVMLTYEDGVIIKAAMANGPVNMTIGNVMVNNDLHIDNTTILNGPVGTIPASQLSGFSFPPGSAVTNRGETDAHNIDVNCVIKFTPAAGGAATTVYNKTGPLPLLQVDSTVLVTLPNFTPEPTLGRYNFSYTTTSDSIDNVDYDNKQGSEFTVTNNVYCKGRWDAVNKRPYQTTATSVLDMPKAEFLAGFRFPKGGGLSLDSVKFYISTQATDLTVIGDETLVVNVYEWKDLNTSGDLDDGELTIRSIEPVKFTTPGVKSAWAVAPVNLYTATSGSGLKIADGSNYFVGIRYSGDTTIFIGFDQAYSYEASIELTPTLTPRIDFGYVLTTNIDNLEPLVGSLNTFAERMSLSAALYVNPAVVGTDDQFAQNVSILLLPNPVSDELVAEVSLLETVESLEYSIFDASGRQVSRMVSDMNGNGEKALFNVSKFPAGQYFLQVKSEKGSKTTPFTVQH